MANSGSRHRILRKYLRLEILLLIEGQVEIVGGVGCNRVGYH